MRSVISSYAIEGRATDGSPNGSFFLDRDCMRKVANEVVGTHFQFSGDKKKEFIDSKFSALWNHWDVNNQGYLVVEKAPQFLKMLVGENEMNNQLQVQMGEEIHMGHHHHKHSH